MKPLLIGLLFLAPSAAKADLLLSPLCPEVPEVDASIQSSLVAPDGSVFIRGEFSAIDGVPRPGLAKLTPRGKLDQRFRPEMVPAPLDQFASGRIILFGTTIGHPLFLTGDGTLLSATSDRLLAYAPDGSWDHRFDHLHLPETTLTPVGERAGLLYLTRQSDGARRLEAYHATTLLPVPLSDQNAWPQPFLNAVPADEAALWVIAGVGSSYLGTPQQTIFRIFTNGDLDPTFPPFDLPAGHAVSQLFPQPGGGVRIVSYNADRFRYWPTPSQQSFRIRWLSPTGDTQRSEDIVLAIGTSLVTADEPDGALLHNIGPAPFGRATADDFRFAPSPALVRLRPDGTRDPDFQIPLKAVALHRLPDGRLQHSHLHRTLPDGSPDPRWQLPRASQEPAVEIVGTLPDGSTLTVLRQYLSLDGSPVTSGYGDLHLLNKKLRPDRHFHPSPDLPAWTNVKIAPDGAILLSLPGDHLLPDGSRTSLINLRRDGSIDPNSPRFRTPSRGFSIDPDGTIIPGPPAGTFVAHPLPSGAILIDHFFLGGEVAQRSISRLHPDGNTDPGFTPIRSYSTGGTLFLLPDDSFLVNTTHYSSQGQELQQVPLTNGWPVTSLPSGHILFATADTTYTSQLAKWHPQHGLDPTFATSFLEGSSITGAHPLPNGSLLVTGFRLITPQGETRIVRLNPDGSLDPTFQSPLPQRVLPRSPRLHHILQNGETLPATFPNRAAAAGFSSLSYDHKHQRLLLAGDFTHLDGHPRPGLAALHQHPAHRTKDEPRLQLLPGTPPCFCLPLQSDAEPANPILELSSNLRDWHPAQDDEVLIEREEGRIIWRLKQSDPTLFGRLQPPNR